MKCVVCNKEKKKLYTCDICKQLFCSKHISFDDETIFDFICEDCYDKKHFTDWSFENGNVETND